MVVASIAIALAAAVTLTACGAVTTVSSSEQTASSTPNVVYPDGYGPDATSEPSVPEPATPEAGTLENPFPKGHTATISQSGEDYYSVMFTLVAANADKKIAAANQFNDKAPRGYHYVIVKATSPA